MPRKTAKQIVEESLPDLELVDESFRADAKAAGPRATRPGASLAELRRKYLGADFADEVVGLAGDLDDPGGIDDDVEVRQVRSKTTPADPADDPGPRAIIVSKRGGILGAQG